VAKVFDTLLKATGFDPQWQCPKPDLLLNDGKYLNALRFGVCLCRTGALRDKLQAMLRLLCRSLSSIGGSWWSPLLRRLVMAVVLVYILVVKMNPGQ